MPDFEQFYASYRRYRRELSPEELKQLINNGLINIRENPLIIEIIRKMFDFDLEVGDIERDVFYVKDKLELIFNFMDISFQLMDDPMDINIANLLKKMNELRKYYDRKSLTSSELASEKTRFLLLR